MTACVRKMDSTTFDADAYDALGGPNRLRPATFDSLADRRCTVGPPARHVTPPPLPAPSAASLRETDPPPAIPPSSWRLTESPQRWTTPRSGRGLAITAGR